MKQILKTYNLELKVQGPVFVGNGEEIQKKEYVFLNGRHALGVVDIEKLYQLARKKGLASDMEQFMVRDTRTTLRQWSDSHRIKSDELKACMKYIVDAGDMQQEKGRMQIMACIKDPYGKPYIPGSSIKGMLRTILLGAEMIQHPEKYEHLAENIQDDLYNGNERNRKKVLSVTPCAEVYKVEWEKVYDGTVRTAIEGNAEIKLSGVGNGRLMRYE